MAEKRYAAVKKVSLAGLSEQWDDECFAYVIPAVYADQQAILSEKLREKSDEEQIAYQVKYVKDRFISGKIKVFDGSDFTLADMTGDDTAASVAICDHLYSAINGFDLDPKDIRKAAEASALPKIDESSTEITSSES
jgi:hypothetical protein